MTGCPNLWERKSPYERAKRSVSPPAGNPQTILIVLVGHASAQTDANKGQRAEGGGAGPNNCATCNALGHADLPNEILRSRRSLKLTLSTTCRGSHEGLSRPAGDHSGYPALRRPSFKRLGAFAGPSKRHLVDCEPRLDAQPFRHLGPGLVGPSQLRMGGGQPVTA